MQMKNPSLQEERGSASIIMTHFLPYYHLLIARGKYMRMDLSQPFAYVIMPL